MASISLAGILYALLGGILPAILWLLFWLEEDRLHPEPRRYIAYTFIGGMCIIPLVIYLQQSVSGYAHIFGTGTIWGGTITAIQAGQFGMWALIEEFFKFSVAFILALWRKFDDEPIDVVIYMITAALGFSALENVLFLAGSLDPSNPLAGILMGNLRFVGASLLHVMASGILGASLAFAFYSSKKIKVLAFLIGILGATTLHTLFNLFIIGSKDDHLLDTFALVWIMIIVLMIVFEKIKRIKPKRYTSY